MAMMWSSTLGCVPMVRTDVLEEIDDCDEYMGDYDSMVL